MKINKFPLQPNSKIPAVKWQLFQTEPTPDWSTTQYATYRNWGLVLGAFTQLCVVDTDSEEGTATFAWLDEYNSPKAKTRKGFHFYFSVPAGISVPRKIRCGSDKIGADLLGNGSYVVCPPSIVEGFSYEWIRPLLPDQAPPELPQKVLDMFLYFKPTPEGSRNQTLFNDVVATKSRGRDQSEALFQAKGFCDKTGLSQNVANDIVARVYGSESYPMTTDSRHSDPLPAILDSTGSKAIQRSIPALAGLSQPDRDAALEKFQAKYRRITDKDLSAIEDKIEQYLDSLAQIDGLFLTEMVEYDLLKLLVKNVREIARIIDGSPYIWLETHWESCTKNVFQQTISATLDKVVDSLGEREQRLFKKKFGKLSTINGVVTLVPKQAEIKFDGKDNFFLLNTPSGTYDFIEQKMLPHNKEHLITACTGCGVEFQEPVMFIKFLREILSSDEGVEPKDIDDILLFLQCYFGNALVSNHSAANDIMLCFLGQGSNGKSVLQDILLFIFGSYFGQANSYMFDRSTKNVMGNDLIPFIGKRLMLVNETGVKSDFDELKLKQILSNEPLTGRALYQEFQQFTLHCKPILTSNHEPTFSDDPALWKRLVIFEFSRFFDKSQAVDKLERKIFETEGSKILGWLVQGYYILNSKTFGGKLQIPPSIESTTLSHRGKSDIIAYFVAEHISRDKDSKVELNQLTAKFNSFKRSQTAEMADLSSRKFGQSLRLMGFDVRKSTDNKTFVVGIKYSEFKNEA